VSADFQTDLLLEPQVNGQNDGVYRRVAGLPKADFLYALRLGAFRHRLAKTAHHECARTGITIILMTQDGTSIL
jgi:hypothetical protein